jgi:2-amino-4-hydroxy-6-hydroxymethyldihydropteridine diphosphokinase
MVGFRSNGAKVTKVLRSENSPTASRQDFVGQSWKPKTGHESPMHKRVYLSLGSNVGDRAGNLEAAIERLGKLGKVMAVSSFYETEPVEFAAQPWFLNCVVELDTERMPKQLLAAILDIEKEMGRRRIQKKGPRTLDIDILLFGNSIVKMKGLTIPHPAMHERRFVLEPLAEIAPEARHPVLKRSIRELRDALPPGQTVKPAPKN